MITIRYQIISDSSKVILDDKKEYLIKECKNVAEANKFLLEIINDVPTGYHIKILGTKSE